MAARVRGTLRDLEVAARWRTHEHGVRPRPKRRVEIVEHGETEFGLDVTSVVTLERFRDDVRQPPPPEREQLQPVAGDGAQVPRMPLTDGAETGDQDAHVTPRPGG